MLKGSCCCQAVEFEVLEKPTMMGMCHCNRCRKLGASALVFVKGSQFNITKGRELITTYAASPPYVFDRCFCGKCGTALGEVFSTMESFPVNAHCFDSELEIDNQFHEFVAEKPCWFKIGDNAKQFERHPE